jgi:hypothetical protein
MMEQYKRLPEWLRWILLLPLSGLFSFLVIFLLSFLRDDFELVHSVVAIISFLIAIYAIAPRWKSKLVLTFLILRMAISIGTVSFVFIHEEMRDQKIWFEIGRELLGWGVGWLFYFVISRGKYAIKSNA